MEPIECDRCGKEFKAIGLVTTALADDLFAKIVTGDGEPSKDSDS